MKRPIDTTQRRSALTAGAALLGSFLISAGTQAGAAPTPTPSLPGPSVSEQLSDTADDIATDYVTDHVIWPVIDGVGYAWDAVNVIDWATG